VPGQRDALHSHPTMLYYWIKPCSMRFHLPDGTVRDLTVSAGQTGTQLPVAAYSVENISKSECKIVMFEAK
jgi:beta-alanine degradation protein BauB